MDEARTLAQELSHPFSLVFALSFGASIHLFRREVQATQELAEAAITLSTAQGIAQWLAQGTMSRGWALAMQGQGEEGLAQIRQGLTAWRATGAGLVVPRLAQLAESYGKAGQADEGLRILAEALAHVDKMREHYYEAELHRLKGELLLQLSLDNATEAETCFNHALDIARHQEAKSLVRLSFCGHER
jgi:predicted ATPase